MSLERNAAPAAASPHDAGEVPMSTLDRVREVIRAEVAQANPADESRRALELIVETSLRYEERDGALRITVIDNDGRPRTKVENGRTRDLTIADLVRELRREHPALFRAPSGPQNRAGETSGARPGGAGTDAATANLNTARASATLAAGAGAAGPELSGAEPAAARDVLSLGSPPPEAAPSVSASGASREPRSVAGWIRTGTSDWLAPAFRAAAARMPRLDSFRTAKADVYREGPAPRGWVPRLSGRAALSLVAVALLVPLAGMLALSLIRDTRRPAEASAAAAVRPASEPEATGAVPGPEPAPAGAAGTLRGVAEVLDTATLSIQGKVVRLFGVEWAKGAGEPDDLARYLRGREVVCRAETGTDKHRCEVQGQDLSRVVLFNGGGRATPEATPDLKAAEEQARSQQRGVWGGESVKARP